MVLQKQQTLLFYHSFQLPFYIHQCTHFLQAYEYLNDSTIAPEFEYSSIIRIPQKCYLPHVDSIIISSTDYFGIVHAHKHH